MSQAAVFGIVVGCAAVALVADAEARSHSSGRAGAHHGGYASGGHRTHGRDYSIAHYYGGGGLQCVPFARENTGIELAGNAANWWENAEGIYQRGARPEVGSVLNFRANGHMRMGHVAVVSNVIDSRNIEIDHANWSGHGVIGRNINVVDVSAGNDWSAVRVALGSGEFGSIYPTFGFIYDRPDHGTMLANNGVVPTPSLGTALHDLRSTAERAFGRVAQHEEIASNLQDDEQEVAEAADDAQPRTRRVSRHGSRHEAYAMHDGFGTRHFISRSGREAPEARLAYAGGRGGHGASHEVYGRTPVVRTHAHEVGGGHALHPSRRRT